MIQKIVVEESKRKVARLCPSKWINDEGIWLNSQAGRLNVREINRAGAWNLESVA